MGSKSQGQWLCWTAKFCDTAKVFKAMFPAWWEAQSFVCIDTRTIRAGDLKPTYAMSFPCDCHDKDAVM